MSLSDALNNEVANSRRLEVINRDLIKQHLRDESELGKKENLITELNKVIETLQNDISKVKIELYNVRKESGHKDKHIQECERIIQELEKTISKLKERIKEVLHKKTGNYMENLRLIPVETLVQSVDVKLDTIINHFVHNIEITAPQAYNDLSRVK